MVRSKALKTSAPMSGKMIDVNLSDMRFSTWNNTPRDQQIQEDFLLKDVYITGNDVASFKNLERKIEEEMPAVQSSKIFEISNSDFVRINSGNIGMLSNQQCLVLLDANQETFPFSYRQRYSTVPHTRAVTNQIGKFYGTEEHNPAAFALAELVDNSLAATVHNPPRKDRIIEIRFYENGDNSSVHVLDNGCGMNSETLKSSLKYKAPKEGRLQYVKSNAEIIADANEDVHPVYINSDISKFGAGLKQAVFWIGEETRIMTKREDSENVCEVRYSRNLMEEKELVENEDPWIVEQYTGKLGQLRDPEVSPIVKQIIQEIEPSKTSFTHISIQNIRKGGDNCPLSFLQKKDTKDSKESSIEKQLAHVYHYYIHGRNGNCADAKKAPAAEIIVKRFNSKQRLVSDINLRNLPEYMWDLETTFIRTATPDPFRFTIEAAEFNSTNVGFKVGGIIRYHPFLYDGETNPTGIVTRILDGENGGVHSGFQGNGSSSEETENIDETETLQETSRTSGGFFQIWWNGRLIPHTRLESFDWCSPKSRMKTNDKLYKSYGRISGSLYFNSKISEITENKLNITTTAQIMKMLSENKIGGYQSSFSQIKSIGDVLKPIRMAPKKNFEVWLKKCQKYDKQVVYSGLIRLEPETVKMGSEKFKCYAYKCAKWDKLQLRVGDAVKLTGNNSPVGRITAFFVKAEHCVNPDAGNNPSHPKIAEKLHAPLYFFQMELLPSVYYGSDRVRVKEMRLIDKKNVPDAERLIQQQVEDLNLKLIKPEWCDHAVGLRVPMNGILVELLKFDIVDARCTTVNGCLSHYETPKTKKPIRMIGRLYQLLETGARRLMHTTAICNYSTEHKGYYFQNLDLNAMNVQEPGNYIMTFRSFLEIKDSFERVPDYEKDPPFEIEWEQEVDCLGRKILVEENTRIRLPFWEMEFFVVVGQPSTFDIEEIGEEGAPLRVGQPFNIALSLKDSKGNKTVPENWETLTSQRPSISLVPSKKSPQFNLNFNFKDMHVSENLLVIRDVVATGHLGGSNFKECNIEVGIEFNGKVCKRRQNGKIVLHSGVPEQIQILNVSTHIENGTRSYISCQVLDCCGNVISHSQKDGKPILLRCDIYKLGDNQREEFYTTRHVLATSLNDDPQGMDDTLDLEELKTGVFQKLTLLSKVYYESYSGIKPASIVITVTPSTKPERLRLYQKSSNGLLEIEKGTEIVKNINDQLELVYKMFDGLGREVSFDSTKHKIKLNWPESVDVENGLLPVLGIPTRTETMKKVVVKIETSGFKEKLSSVFYLTTRPLNPHGLKTFFKRDSVSSNDQVLVPIDQVPPCIIAQITDCYDNIITDISPEQLVLDLEVSVDGCNVNYDTISGNEIRAVELVNDQQSFLITNVRVRTEAGGHLSLGEVVLNIAFKQFATTLKYNTIAGSPHGLLFEIDGEIQQRPIVSVLNQSKLRICARLVDAFQNVTKPPVLTTIKLSLGNKSEWMAQDIENVSSFVLKKNVKEIADFGFFNVGVKPNQNRELICPFSSNSCGGKCFGKKLFIQADVEALEQDKKISTSCQFHVLCRPDVPFKLVVRAGGNGEFVYKAGSTFDNLSVTLEAEDGNKFLKAEKDHLRLVLSNSKSSNEPLVANDVEEGVYSFGEVPTIAGLYKAEFIYTSGIIEISTTEEIQICCDEISCLEWDQDGGNLSVSNDPENHQTRVIAENLKLVLKDQFQNVYSTENFAKKVEGAVTMKLLNSNQTVLQNQSSLESTQFQIINGQTSIPELKILPNLNLVNNSEYIIRFTAVIADTESEFLYDLKFTFFDDLKQQEEMRILEGLNYKLGKEIQKVQAEVASAETVNKGLRVQFENLKSVENKHRQFMSRTVPREIVQNLKTVGDVGCRKNVLQTNEARLIEERMKTTTNIAHQPESDEPGVLGIIGLLAQIISEGGGIEADLRLQRVISWHLQAYLDVTVTETEEKGHELRNRFPRKQFMLLDIIKDTNVNWNDNQISGPGNPIYARSLLKLTKEDERSKRSIQKVFNKILGNTIIVDDLTAATRFMKEYNQSNRFGCPTILTRDCYRLSSTGIIGGNSNQAPERKLLRLLLGIAPVKELGQIKEELRLLHDLHTAIIATEQARQKFEENEIVFRKDEDKLSKELRILQIQQKDVQKKLQDFRSEQLQRGAPSKRDYTNADLSRPRSPDPSIKKPRMC